VSPLSSPRATPSAPSTPPRELAAAFLDRLDDLPRAGWIAVGRRLLADPAGHASRQAAAAALTAAIAEQGLVVAAWRLRDAVETAAQLASAGCLPHGGRRGALAPCTASERRALEAARLAAERAVLALLVHRWLSAEDYARLVSPFAAERLAPVALQPG